MELMQENSSLQSNGKINLCYTVFHLPTEKNSTRIKCVEKIRNFLPYDQLPNTTTSIKSIEEVKGFLINNPDFKLDLEGYDPNYKRNFSTYDKENAQPLGWLPEEIGIWASNYLSYKSFLETDYEYCLIMEDDLRVEPEFPELLEKYIKELPESWDVFYMFSPPPLYFGESVSENLSKPYTMWSNACYLVSRQGAEKIIDSVENDEVHLPADWYLLKQLHKFNIYTVKWNHPKGCHLEGVQSTYWKINRRPRKLTGLV